MSDDTSVGLSTAECQALLCAACLLSSSHRYSVAVCPECREALSRYAHAREMLRRTNQFHFSPEVQ